jgi:L-iditol 2-dehydrogenase
MAGPAGVRAATLVAPGQLELRTYPYPAHLEPGAVLVEILASGICGTDKHTFRGETEQYAGTDHASSTPFPIILCRRLENYGNSLTAAVAPHLFGGWADYLYLRPGTPLFKVPVDLPTEVAVLTELFAVTHSLDLVARMPRPGGFRRGDTVAVVGTGPVGLVHAAKAALLGASLVVAVDPYEPRVALAQALGATHPLVGAGEDPAVATAVAELTAGRGVDVVVDATGHPSSFGPALDLLRDGGTLVEVGAFVDLGPVAVNPATILGRNLTIVGVAGEDARAYDATLALLAAHHERVPFHRAVTHQFPLAEIQAAMATALGAGDAMKVVVVPRG